MMDLYECPPAPEPPLDLNVLHYGERLETTYIFESIYANKQTLITIGKEYVIYPGESRHGSKQ